MHCCLRYSTPCQQKKPIEWRRRCTACKKGLGPVESFQSLSRRAIAGWFQPSVRFRWHSSGFLNIFCASSLVQQTWALS